MRKVAIVAGASSGIGKELALLLAKDPEISAVYAQARRLPLLEALAKDNEKIVPVRLDLTVESAFSCLKPGDVPVVSVYAAGVGYAYPVEETGIDNAARCIDLNCRALTRFLSEGAKLTPKGGKLAAIASASAFLPQPYFAVYAASKSFALSLCRAVNAELKRKKITVTAVCPGPVDTEFFSHATPSGKVDEKKKKYLASPEKVARRAYKAIKKGKEVCVPTASMRAARFFSKLLPHGLLVKIYKK